MTRFYFALEFGCDFELALDLLDFRSKNHWLFFEFWPNLCLLIKCLFFLNTELIQLYEKT